jgi:hypothetical protein
MPWDAKYYREKAELCRSLAKLTQNPNVSKELLKLAREFDEEAEKAESRER